MAFPSDLDPTLDVGDTTDLDTEFFAEIDRRILVLEAKVGADDSDVTTSLDYMVRNAGGGGSVANPMTSDLDAGGYTVTGLADPSDDSDAATKLYVDDVAAALVPLSATGDLLVRSSGGSNARLAVGTNGYVLLVVGGMPTWSAVPWITAPSASSGQFLKYDGSQWTATAIAAADVANLGAAALLNVGSGLTSSGGSIVVDTTITATRSYVDATVGGLLYKAACRVVATSNVASLSGTTTIDGVALIANNRVLLTAQSTATENGPWVVAAGAWSRPSPSELQASAAFPVSEGTTYHDTVWYLTTNDPITAGVTSISVAQMTLTITTSSISDMTTPSRAMATAASYAAMRTLLSTDTTSDTRTPTDASATLSKLGSDVTVGKLAASELTACAYAATDSSVDVVVGGFRFDPADYAISGKTTVLTVTLWGRVVSGLTGTVTVYDVTSGTPSSVGTASITSTTGALSTVSISLPVSAKTYQLAIKVSGGSTAADIVEVTGAARRITWS